MKSATPSATAEQIEYSKFKAEFLKKEGKTSKLNTKHPGRSPREYMDPWQTKEYLANLKAQERLSEKARTQYIRDGLNPLQELRRALETN